MPKQLLVALVAVLLVAGLAACGGSDDDSGTTTAADPAATEDGSKGSSDDSGTGAGEEESGSSEIGEGTAPFIVKGGDNSIQEFGSEADRSDLDAAAASVQGYFDARAAGDWDEACTYLSEGGRKGFEQLASGAKQLQGKDCGAILGALTEGVPQASLDEAAQVDAGALRVEDEQAFLLYHGVDDTDFAIPMANEDDGWKVAALAGTPLN